MVEATLAAYRNYMASLLRFCERFARDRNNFGHNLVAMNFDAHHDVDKLPLNDLVGLSNFSLQADEGAFLVECMVGITTYNDENGFRLMELVDAMFQQLLPTQRIPVVDALSGAPLSHMVILGGTTAMPVTGNDTRPAVFIQISALSDAPPSLRGS